MCEKEASPSSTRLVSTYRSVCTCFTKLHWDLRRNDLKCSRTRSSSQREETVRSGSSTWPVSSFQVRTLPALGTPSPSKKRPLPKSLDAVEGEYGRHSYSGGVSKHLASPQQSLQSTAGLSPTKPFAGTSRSDLAGNSTASALPPLMKGSRLSVLSNAVAAPGMTGDLVPEGGSETVMGVDGKRRWRDRQEAWVERERQGGAEPEEDTEQAFPFLAEDEMALPDDRFEV